MHALSSDGLINDRRTNAQLPRASEAAVLRSHQIVLKKVRVACIAGKRNFVKCESMELLLTVDQPLFFQQQLVEQKT